MKKISRILTIMMIIFVISFSSLVFASEEYVLRKEMEFINETNTTLNKGFAEICIGKKNFTEYQKDKSIVVTPAPDDIKTDEYGNYYAYYNLAGYRPGRALKVTIERRFEIDTFFKEVAVRSEASVDSLNALYVAEQGRIESKNPKIIAKAKEITEGLSSDYKRARALFEYVNTEMEYNTSASYANKGSVSALENSKGVCEEYATLYAAMCRAIEIPCKVVEGYTFVNEIVKESETVFDNTIGDYVITEPEYEYKLTNHVWNEIFLDDYGWLPVDTCVVYNVNGKREPYFGSFCKIENEEYIANGIYNTDMSDRYMRDVTEKSFTEKLYLASDLKKEDHSFQDIGNYGWAESAINTLYDMDIIKGYSDTEYGPAGNVSRIEFVSLLARALRSLNYQVDSKGMVYYFMDYDRKHYSKNDYDYLMRCLEIERPYDKFAIGYYSMSSIFGDRIDINKPITRAEVVALLDPFLEGKIGDTPNFTDIDNNRFRSSILKAYSNELIKGYGDGTFKPNGTITRAEIAVVLDRYVGIKDYVI